MGIAVVFEQGIQLFQYVKDRRGIWQKFDTRFNLGEISIRP